MSVADSPSLSIPDLYPWHDMPADRRDRDTVLRIAETRGIRPAWADRARSPWQRMQSRLDRAEILLATMLTGGAA